MGKFRIAAVVFLVVQLFGDGFAWGGQDKVKLKDIEVLTLSYGAMTTGRRSSPVPQLKCVGGTANGAFTPQVVQCYNRGSDGYDVQWECKTDMDNAYRFGKVSVTCEGYDYPDDPYVLKGSCGLEYTLDFTKEGMQNARYSQNHDYYGGGGQAPEYGWNHNVYKDVNKQSNWVTNVACGAVVVVIVYAIYKTCISPTEETRQRSTTNDDYHGRGPGSGTSPPPPGFRSNYYSSNDGGFYSGSDSCGSSSRSAGAGTAGTGAGGFWTGAATGGLLGYMFGSRNNTQYGGGGTYYRSRPFNSGWGGAGSSSGWGSGFSSGSSSSSSSSGTRTASGFGGTSRR